MGVRFWGFRVLWVLGTGFVPSGYFAARKTQSDVQGSAAQLLRLSPTQESTQRFFASPNSPNHWKCGQAVDLSYRLEIKLAVSLRPRFIRRNCEQP
jgi:hypothetical protein